MCRRRAGRPRNFSAAHERARAALVCERRPQPRGRPGELVGAAASAAARGRRAQRLGAPGAAAAGRAERRRDQRAGARASTADACSAARCSGVTSCDNLRRAWVTIRYTRPMTPSRDPVELRPGDPARRSRSGRGVYVWRFRAARREAGGRGAGLRAGAAFAAGSWSCCSVALVSPIDALGEDYLFSAHMIQHILLGDIAPLLLLLVALARDHAPRHAPLPRRRARARPARAPGDRHRAVVRAALLLAHPRAVRRGDRERRRPRARARVVLHRRRARVVAADPAGADAPQAHRPAAPSPTSLAAKSGLAALGLYLTWSKDVAYPYYETVPRIWGLSPIDDQNVGGAIMMVEQSLVLVDAFCVLFMRMLRQSEEDELPPRAARGRGARRLTGRPAPVQETVIQDGQPSCSTAPSSMRSCSSPSFSTRTLPRTTTSRPNATSPSTSAARTPRSDGGPSGKRARSRAAA